MKLLSHHFKKSDSYMWMNWVRHDAYGLIPRLRINHTILDTYFYFDFTWWKFHWYWAKSANVINDTNMNKRKEDIRQAAIDQFGNDTSVLFALCGAFQKGAEWAFEYMEKNRPSPEEHANMDRVDKFLTDVLTQRVREWKAKNGYKD